jgi:hypothetical protein
MRLTRAMPYRTIQSLYDAIFPKGRDRCYWKSLYLQTLDDNVISDIVSQLSKRPSDMTYASIWKFGSAVQSVPAAATAFGDRSAPFMLSLDAIWSSRRDGRSQANAGNYRRVNRGRRR